MEENRELLSRRLARLGYSVEALDGGKPALERIALQGPDLILLDILMPGLDGFEVLRQLKANPLTQHIPVIMLSSADQIRDGVAASTGSGRFLPNHQAT